MSSLASLVAIDGPLSRALRSRGADVHALQISLTQAGYRVTIDPTQSFTDDTDYWTRQFQRQHGLTPDGEVGTLTASMLDAPHAALVATAIPLVHPDTGWPHDDTASLLAHYGRPWENDSLITHVPVPFPMTYREDNGVLRPVTGIAIHVKCADALRCALGDIALRAKSDPSVLRRVQHFSGSGNYRPIRGSSRLSCHAFWAAIDFDAEDLPLGMAGVSASDMPQGVVDAFNLVRATWGNTYLGRKDPMHFQFAHE